MSLKLPHLLKIPRIPNKTIRYHPLAPAPEGRINPNRTTPAHPSHDPNSANPPSPPWRLGLSISPTYLIIGSYRGILDHDTHHLGREEEYRAANLLGSLC